MCPEESGKKVETLGGLHRKLDKPVTHYVSNWTSLSLVTSQKIAEEWDSCEGPSAGQQWSPCSPPPSPPAPSTPTKG